MTRPARLDAEGFGEFGLLTGDYRSPPVANGVPVP